MYQLLQLFVKETLIQYLWNGHIESAFNNINFFKNLIKMTTGNRLRTSFVKLWNTKRNWMHVHTFSPWVYEGVKIFDTNSTTLFFLTYKKRGGGS